MEKPQTKQGTAPTTVYAISRLAETVMKRDIENLKSMGGEHPEVKTLKEKCKDADALTSTTACHALVALVEAGVLSIPYTLSTFIAILPFCSTHVGVTSAIGKLLIFEMKMHASAEKKYKSPFNLQSPQHPLLTVLKQNKDSSWHHVINQISYLCTHRDDVVQSNSSELVRPLVLYMLCDPGNRNAPYRQQLWTILLAMPDTSLLKICLPWLQLNDAKCIQPLYLQLVSSIKLKKCSENDMLSTPNVVLHLAGLAHTLVLSGADPRPILAAIDELLEDCCTFTGSCIIMIMAQTVLKTPPIYLSAIVSLCTKIFKLQLCIYISGKMFIAAMLPWMAHPSILTAEALQEAQNLLANVENLAGVIMTKAPIISQALSIIHFSVQICTVINSWSGDSDVQLHWIQAIIKIPMALKSELCLLIGGLVIQETTSSILLSNCLSFLLDFTAELPEMGSAILTWLLYRLAKEHNAEDQLQLLRALPNIGRQKENVALVIHTLESLKGCIPIKSLILNLYLRLWHQEPRCFPYLHKMLAETLTEKSEIQRQWNIARAAAMKEICDTRPNLHGTELVPILSNILNNCMGDDGAVASSLALQAIGSLCRARIVDVATTWKALAPRLSRDTRVPVIKSLCDVLGMLSKSKSNAEQNKLFAEAQTKLWNYVVNNSNPEVKAAALKGLAQFSLDQLSLKIMPPCYRQNLKLPAEYAKTPIDAARKPEDVLTYIPGECWPQLLAAVPSATEFLKTLLTVEVSTMRGALHRHPGKAEPTLPSLPRNSVCLGLISHLRRNTFDDAVVPCLEVLTSAMPQNLPPCDWSFLYELAQREQCHTLCFKLAASQAHCSPSAQAVVEQLIQNISTSPFTKNDVLAGFRFLGYFCKGVPPKTLRPFIERAIQTTLAATQKEDRNLTLFQELMGHIKKALQREDIHDANRNLLSVLLEGLHDQLSMDDTEVFDCYVECVGELSSKYLERMSSPSVWWEITSVKLQKAIAVRSYVAVQGDTEDPLVWLNECIDAAATNPREQNLLMRKLHGVLVLSRGKSSSKDWLLELMGHIQAALTSTDKRGEAGFLFDVFALAVLVLSGHDCLYAKPADVAESKEIQSSLLPQALHSLLQHPDWSQVTSQVLEWLHHLIKSSVICADTKPVLYTCLQALRHSEPMQQPTVWQRLVSY